MITSRWSQALLEVETKQPNEVPFEVLGPLGRRLPSNIWGLKKTVSDTPAGIQEHRFLTFRGIVSASWHGLRSTLLGHKRQQAMPWVARYCRVTEVAQGHATARLVSRVGSLNGTPGPEPTHCSDQCLGLQYLQGCRWPM